MQLPQRTCKFVVTEMVRKVNIALTLFSFAVGCFGQLTNGVQVQELKPTQTFDREMNGAETHLYSFDLGLNEFFQVRVEQKDLDVALRLLDTKGNVLATMDSPNGKQGPERISFIADQPGRFTLEVVGVNAKSAKGNYSIRRAASQTATATDRRRVDTERLFIQGVTLVTKAAPGSSEKEVGLAKLEQANKGWHELADTEMATLTERTLRVSRLVAQFLAPTLLVLEGQKLRNKETVEAVLAARSKYFEAVDAGHRFMKRLVEEDLSDVLTREVKADWKASTIVNDVQAFGGIALTYELLKDPQESVVYHQRALEVIKEIRASPEISSILVSHDGIPIKASEASSLNSVGSILTGKLDRPEQGLKYSAQAVAEWEEVEREYGKFRMTAQQQQAVALQNVAQSYFALDDRRKAIESLEKALALFRGLDGQKKMEAECLIQIADYSSRELDYQRAREALDEALRIYEALGNKPGQATVLGLMGLSHFVLNDQTKAREFFNRKLSILLSDDYIESLFKANPTIILPSEYKVDPGTARIDLSAFYRDNLEWQRSINVGYIHSMLEEPDKAREYFAKALTAARATKSMGSIHVTLNAIGITYSNQTRWSQAEDYHQQALVIGRQLPQKSDLARDLSGLAFIQMQLKNWPEALKSATEALLLYQSLGADQKILLVGYASTLNLIARIQDELGNRRLAIFYEKQAVNAIQRERQQLKNLDVAAQRGYAKKNEKPYRRLAEWLTAEGRIPEAEQVMRMLKEDEYFQYLRRDYQVAKDLLFTVSLEADEAAAAERYDQFADKLTAIGREYGELQAEKNRPEYERRPFPKQARLDELDKMLNDARVVSQKFLDDLDVKFKQKDIRVAEIKSGFQSMLKDMKARRTVIVSTIVDDDRLTIFITTADSQRAHAVDIKAVEVDKLVSYFRAAVMNPKIDPRDAGKRLYDIVLAPIEKDLAGINADTIVWSLDGTLRYAPMAAMWDGQHYLAERYANVIITLASQKYLEQPLSDKSKWRALGVGVSRNFEGFPALPAVPDELDCIITDPVAKSLSLHPQCQRGVMNGTKLLDEKFTKVSFKNALGRYALVHVASHFSLQPGDAYRSFLLLGGGATEKDRKLMVSEINQSLFSGVEILTLSACNTAVGTERSNGQEVEGFGALAQKEGAKAVIATLWEVADRSTRDFMVKFYSLYNSPLSVNKAQALRQAQLVLLRGGNRRGEPSNRVRSSVRLNASENTFIPDPNAKYSHPYYWSPFILIGNWR